MARKYEFDVAPLGNGLYSLAYVAQDGSKPFELTFKTAEAAKEYASKWIRGQIKDEVKVERFTVEVDDNALTSGDEVRSTTITDQSSPTE